MEIHLNYIVSQAQEQNQYMGPIRKFIHNRTPILNDSFFYRSPDPQWHFYIF